MKKAILRFFVLVALCGGLTAPSVSACNNSSLSLVSVTGSGPYVITVNLCVGMGRTGSVAGGDRPTLSVFHGFFSSTPGFSVLTFTPADMIGPPKIFPAGPGCSMHGYYMGLSAYNSQEYDVLFVDPGYYGDHYCMDKPYGCIDDNAKCGPAQAWCTNFSYTCSIMPDSLHIFGVEGSGDPQGGCKTSFHSDMTIIFSTALAEDWGAFRANPSAAGINLHWSTLSESNSDHFIVERSVDGTIFEPIGEVGAAGTSSVTLNYAFFDMNPVVGRNRYRIVQVDNAGDFFDSEVIEVNYSNPKGLNWGTVGPNPFVDQLEVSFFSPSKCDLNLSIFDVAGRQVLSLPTAAEIGGNALQLDLSKLLAGSYFLRLEGLDTKVVRKIVKL